MESFWSDLLQLIFQCVEWALTLKKSTQRQSLKGKKVCLNVQVHIYWKICYFLANKEDPIAPPPEKQLGGGA